MSKFLKFGRPYKLFFGELERMAYDTGFVQRLSKLTRLKFVEIRALAFWKSPVQV